MQKQSSNQAQGWYYCIYPNVCIRAGAAVSGVFQRWGRGHGPDLFGRRMVNTAEPRLRMRCGFFWPAQAGSKDQQLLLHEFS
jgi:hypothetical protein